MTEQKMRAQPAAERARASGGGLRSQPVEGPPGRSASTGGWATRSMARHDNNSRSSNAGREREGAAASNRAGGKVSGRSRGK